MIDSKISKVDRCSGGKETQLHNNWSWHSGGQSTHILTVTNAKGRSVVIGWTPRQHK